jgi:hypothetical protein
MKYLDLFHPHHLQYLWFPVLLYLVLYHQHLLHQIHQDRLLLGLLLHHHQQNNDLEQDLEYHKMQEPK